MTDLTPLLFVVAMGLGGLVRSWADDRQDTRSRYTVFDVLCTAVSGLFAPQLLAAIPWVGAWTAGLRPLPMAGLLFVLSALLSLLVFETARRLAPELVAKLAERAQGRVRGAVAPIIVGLAVVLAAPPELAADGAKITHGYKDCGTTSALTGIGELAGATGQTRYRIITLQNDSNADLYLKLNGEAAVVNEGHRLNANGGTIVLDIVVANGPVTCIHGSSGSKRLLWWYGTR